jgi:hypothetical protein
MIKSWDGTEQPACSMQTKKNQKTSVRRHRVFYDADHLRGFGSHAHTRPFCGWAYPHGPGHGVRAAPRTAACRDRSRVGPAVGLDAHGIGIGSAVELVACGTRGRGWDMHAGRAGSMRGLVGLVGRLDLKFRWWICVGRPIQMITHLRIIIRKLVYCHKFHYNVNFFVITYRYVLLSSNL